MHKTEIENSSTGGKAGKFYTLKLICDVDDFDSAAITSLMIDGTETITGYVRNINYKSGETSSSETEYINISQVGVKLSDMVSASGTIESTEGYEANNTVTQNDDSNNESHNNESSGNGGSSGGGGCNSMISVSGVVILLCALIIRRKI